MIRRMFLSKRFRAGVAGLVVGSVALSGCAHNSDDSMFAKVWPFGKDKDKTAASSDTGETRIASSTPAAPKEETPSVRQRIGNRFAKLVGRERDEFPQDPFMAEYSNGLGAQQAVAQAPAGVANIGEMGGIQTVSGREAIKPKPAPPQPQTGQTNQFAANFGRQADQIGHGTVGSQQQTPSGDLSQQRIDDLRASLRRDMLGNTGGEQGLGQSQPNPSVRPIPDQSAQVAQQNSATNPFSAEGSNPFEDPRLLNVAPKRDVQNLPPASAQNTAAAPNPQANRAFNNLKAFEDGFEHGAKISQGAFGQTNTGLVNAIQSDDGFAHGRAALESPKFPEVQPSFDNPSNGTTQDDEDSLYNQIRESEDVPSGKFYGPRDFDAVQTNQSINLNAKPSLGVREIPSAYESADPGFNAIQRTSNEIPNVTSNQSVSLPQIEFPSGDDAGPSFSSNDPGSTIPGGLGGPLMITPEDSNSSEEPNDQLAKADVVPQSPIKKVEWSDDDFVVENSEAEESSSWPTIMLLAAGLAAIVGLMIRRNGSKPDTPLGLRLLQDDDSDRKAA